MIASKVARKALGETDFDVAEVCLLNHCQLTSAPATEVNSRAVPAERQVNQGCASSTI